jgi:F0F1-type ATP synthase assembly protein I
LPAKTSYAKIASVSVMPNNDKKNNGWWSALSLLGQLGYVIAVPLVIFALAGRLLDKKYGTSPWFLLAGMLAALIISSVWVYKKSTEIMNDAEKNSPEKTKNPENEAKK